MTRTVVIVGAGHAGGRCALELRARGHTGPVILIGDEPHAPYERPPLSKEVLRGTADPADAALFDEASAIDLLADCRVVTIDRQRSRVVLDSGTTIAYDTLVLATGVRPRRLPVPGADLAGLHYLHTADEAVALRQTLTARQGRLVVVGGGFVGLEAAASARMLGWRVTVVEREPQCLNRVLPPLSASWLIARHRDRSVDFVCDASVAAIEGKANVTGVRLSDDTVLRADAVLVGIGSAPQDSLAQAAGLRADHGIRVDGDGRTEDPAIFAIGDVAHGPNGRCESWQNAEDSARRAAAAILGGTAEAEAVRWFWTDQYDHNLQILGDPRSGDRLVVRRDPQGAVDAHLWLSDDVLVGAVLFDNGRARRALTRAIGRPFAEAA